MQYLIGIPLAAIIIYFLTIGGVLIWPIVNVVAFLKVLIFPSAIRRKYGTKFHKIDFNDAISSEDRTSMKYIDNTIEAKEKDIESFTKQKIVELKDIKKINDPQISNLKKERSTLQNSEKYKFELNVVKAIIYTQDEQSKNTLINLEKSLIKNNLSLKKLNPSKLPKNSDGSFSQRSNVGKEAYKLNMEINNLDYKKYNLMEEMINVLNKKIRKLEGEIDIISKEINNLKNNSHLKNKELESYIKASDKTKIDILNKPWQEWNTWVSRLARFNSNKHSIIFMIFGFPIFLFIISKYNLLGLKFPTFINVAEIYIYNVFVGPTLQFFDINILD